MSQARTKRKIAIEDSDEGEGCDNTATTQKKGLSAYKSSKEPGKVVTYIHHRAFGCLTLMILGKAKKARVNPSEDDLFLESDDQDDTPSAFSQTLSRFKKSPKKKGKLDNYCPRILIV